MKVIVQFSGGKDSQACLIKACNDYGADKITAVFCDTGWEHQNTYKHIENVVKQLGVKLVVLKSTKYTDFVDDKQVGTAFEWLFDHIHEDDAIDWNYEVDVE